MLSDRSNSWWWQLQQLKCITHTARIVVHAQAMTSTRKGNKKLAIYDLKVTMKWAATDPDDGEAVRHLHRGMQARHGAACR